MAANEKQNSGAGQGKQVPIVPTSDEKLKALQKYLKQALTLQEVDFISYYIGIATDEKGRTKGNISASMKAAGFTVNSGTTDIKLIDSALVKQGKLILRRSGLSLEMSLFAKGVDMDKIAQRLQEGTDAVSPVVFEGKITGEVANFAERRKAVDSILKMLGYGSKARVDIFHHQDQLASDVKGEGKGGGGLFKEGDTPS